jgi:hypothetical protein
MRNNVTKIPVVLKYVSQKRFERADYEDEPRLAGGVNGPGWYWALVDNDGKTDDDWWFGPEPTKEMAHFTATQEGYSIVSRGRHDIDREISQ